MKLLRLMLLLSTIAGFAGIYLLYDSYNLRLSVLAAENQIEYLKTFPQAVKKGDISEMPLYIKDPVFSSQKNLKGYITGSLYNNMPSVRNAEIIIYRTPLSRIRIPVLLDARGRQ